MKRKINSVVLYEKQWRKKRTGETGKTTVEWWKDAYRGNTIIRCSLTKDDINDKNVMFYLPYEGIKVWLNSLAKEHGKEEVERELNIKIGGD
jgi:hypothetical protein